MKDKRKLNGGARQGTGSSVATFNFKILKMESKKFIIGIAYHPHSGNFFIDFSNENGCIISVKVSEGVAVSLAKELGLKILI